MEYTETDLYKLDERLEEAAQDLRDSLSDLTPAQIVVHAAGLLQTYDEARAEVRRHAAEKRFERLTQTANEVLAEAKAPGPRDTNGLTPADWGVES